jgi:hypothetical protein
MMKKKNKYIKKYINKFIIDYYMLKKIENCYLYY